MKFIKPYNESFEIVLHTSQINFDDVKSTFDPDDIIAALEIDNIKASIVNGQYYKKIVDSKGDQIVNFTDRNINQDAFLNHDILFLSNVFKTSNPVSHVGCLFKQPISTDDFDVFINTSSLTVKKFENSCKRVASMRDSKMKLKVNMLESDIENTRNIQLRFHLSIIEKEPVNIKELYNKWKKSFIVISVNNSIKKLKEIYSNHGIKNPLIDINEDDLVNDDTDRVMIGFFTDDEIIVVGTVNKKTGKLEIDQKEYLRSFDQN